MIKYLIMIRVSLALALSMGSVVFADEFVSFPQRPDRSVTTLTLANVFSDGMVLQRDQDVRVWGWSKPGDEVVVKFAGQTAKSKANAKGSWQAQLKPMKASFEDRVMTVTAGGKSLSVKDILIGEVWLCGGQSNMERKMNSSRDADLELASGDYPAIRFLRIPKVANTYPQADYQPAENGGEGHWKKCQSKDLEQCTAVGYYFGQRLHRMLKVPIGLIDTSWGGTMAQHWVEREMLKKLDIMKPYFKESEAAQKAWIDNGKKQGALDHHQFELMQWEKLVKQLKPGERKPGKPKVKTDPVTAHQPAGMLNGLIAPLSGYAIRGVLFYQGENNSFGESWKPYYETFSRVISTFRKSFDQPDLPFGIIQIAGWSTRRSMSYDMNHHCNVVREVQFDIWRKTPNTGLIVSFDANSDGNIHPRHKRPLGERSARWAAAEVYQAKDNRKQPIKWRGPVFEKMEVKDGKCVVTFEKIGAEGLHLDKDVDVGFYIAGEDKIFHHAHAKADRDEVTIWSDAVKKPVAVRYAFSNLPIGGLMNGIELPAYPFRSDNWPIKPHHSEGEYMRPLSRKN